jgi:quinol monooxygenase YgiN
MIYLPAHLGSRPCDHPDLMEAAKAMIWATRLEPGCMPYDLSISVTDPQPTISAEAWNSRGALAEHFESPHMAEWRKASRGYFTERKIEIFHPEKVELL